jgi:hypothetical protein
MEVMGEAPAYVMGTGQGLPPIVSGINPRAVQMPQGTLGALGQGIKRDISQFDNDVFNAQRGITPGYPTLGSEFSSAFVNPKPSVYEMLAGLEPSRIPSTASPAVKPSGKGITAEALGDTGSGMAEDLKRKHTNATTQTAINNWYKEYSATLDPAVKMTYEMDLHKYEMANRPIDPLTGRPTHIITNDMEYATANDFTKQWNAANPNAKVIPPERFMAVADAENIWREGPRKKYIETKMGTGIATDPILALVERTGIALHPEMDAIDTRHEATSADRARANAAAVHKKDPNSYTDVGEYKYPLIGTQTATTPLGKEYENLIDRYIKVKLPSVVGLNNATDQQRQFLTSTTPVYDITEYGQPFSEIDKYFRKELLAGRIKPENIKQYSPERVALELIKDKQAEAAKAAKSNDEYKTFRNSFADTYAEPSLPSGNRFIMFDNAAMNSMGEHMMQRGLSIATYDLDHCVSHCGVPPRRATDPGWDTDPFKKRHFRPMLLPHTGKPPKEADYVGPGMEPPDPATGRIHGYTTYSRGIERNRTRILSLRDAAGEEQVTAQLTVPDRDGKFSVSQTQGYQDEGIKKTRRSGPREGEPAILPEAAADMIDWLNQHADKIKEVGEDYGLNHLGIMDTTRTIRGGRPQAESGLEAIDSNWDYKRVRSIVDEYTQDLVNSGKPPPPRFMTKDRLNAMFMETGRAPFALPDLTPDDHAINLKRIEADINDYNRIKSSFSSSAGNPSHDPALVDMHLDTLNRLRDEQTILGAGQARQKQILTSALNASIAEPLARLVASNITDPNFTFNLDSLPPEFRIVGHALMGNVYSPSMQLPIDLHRNAINAVLSLSPSEVDQLRTYVDVAHHGSPSVIAELNKLGLADAQNLTEPQRANLKKILVNADALVNRPSAMVATDYTPYFARPQELVHDAYIKNEDFANTALNFHRALIESRNNPNPNTLADAHSRARDFRLVASDLIDDHMHNFTDPADPGDMNITAYINDRVQPDIRPDMTILSRLLSNPLQLSIGGAEARKKDFARHYIGEITTGMYRALDLMNTYGDMARNDNFPVSITNNGREVLKQYAAERLFPDQLIKFNEYVNTLDAEQNTLRNRYNIPENRTVPGYMRDEINDPATDPLFDFIPHISTAANALRTAPVHNVNAFMNTITTDYRLNTKEKEAFQTLIGDPNISLDARERRNLHELLFERYITPGMIDRYITRLFDPDKILGTSAPERAKILTIMHNFMKLRGIDLIRMTNEFLTHPAQQGYVSPPNIPNMAKGGRVRRMADGGPVTDTLDKIVKNPQASQMLNLDLPNLIAAKRQAQPLKRGGKVQFTNNVDSMRRALGRH